jgi:hypothetical protein
MNIVRLIAGFGFVILSCSAAIGLLWTISADGWSVFNSIGAICAAAALYSSGILLAKAADLLIQAKGWFGKSRRAARRLLSR